jgi:fatty acid desaturase
MAHTKQNQRTPVKEQAGAVREILTSLRAADARLVERHPWLDRNDAIALFLYFASFAVIGLCGYAWWVGSLSAPFTIIGITLGLSVLHEMEHDLIHDLYLPNQAIRIPVLTTIWFAKASIDPWTRGRWHIWHHAVSGQEEDIEERLIGMGMPWGPRRVLITLLPAASLLVKPSLRRAFIKRAKNGGSRPNFEGPVGIKVITGLLAALPFVAIGGAIAGAAWAWPLLVLVVLPNTLRHSTIVIMSSNSHYADIQRGSILEQNQILDHPIFWPLQFFCWNFGATHVVHHFFVRQPFWRRTLIFRECRQSMVDHGVPANDFGSIGRANRRVA